MKTILVSDTLVFEIWRPGEPTSMLPVAQEFVRVAELLPLHKLGPSIGGFEDDERELIDNPEALAVMKDFCTFLAVLDPLESLKRRIVHECLVVMLIATGGLDRRMVRITYPNKARRNL